MLQHKITLIEAKATAYGTYCVRVQYENGEATIFGDSRVLAGANKMTTQYTNMMRKNGALADNFKQIKLAAA